MAPCERVVIDGTKEETLPVGPGPGFTGQEDTSTTHRALGKTTETTEVLVEETQPSVSRKVLHGAVGHGPR